MNSIVNARSQYLKLGWHSLVHNVVPKQAGCGTIYELGNPLSRPNEDLAIADMRGLTKTEPHYHPKETEVYIVIEGTGIVVVGSNVHEVKPGDSVTIPPGIAHYTVPRDGLVLGVINTPPFSPEGYIALESTNESVDFDMSMYKKHICITSN